MAMPPLSLLHTMDSASRQSIMTKEEMDSLIFHQHEIACLSSNFLAACVNPMSQLRQTWEGKSYFRGKLVRTTTKSAVIANLITNIHVIGNLVRSTDFCWMLFSMWCCRPASSNSITSTEHSTTTSQEPKRQIACHILLRTSTSMLHVRTVS